MKRNIFGPLDTIAAIIVLVLAAGPANGSVVINITQSGGNVDVTATGSLNLISATFDHQLQGFSTGIIPGGSNWYIALGTTTSTNWYQLTSVSVPFGTSGNYFTSSITSGDTFSIWGFAAGRQPLVGVSTGYTSGTPISADMMLPGQTIAGMTLIPGTYTFTIPSDTITLNITGIGSSVPEPSTLAMMLNGFAALGFAVYRRKKDLSCRLK